MKPLPKLLFAVAVLGLALRPSSSFAQAINLKDPAWMVTMLDSAVGLTDTQKAQVREIIQATIAARQALPESAGAGQTVSIHANMRKQIRAILTPAQQKKYDRTPQPYGGGLTLMSPENKLSRLNTLVTLTDAQKPAALKIFEQELEALLAIPETDRPAQGADARQAALSGIRAILTSDQQRIFDAAPQSRGGGRPGLAR